MKTKPKKPQYYRPAMQYAIDGCFGDEGGAIVDWASDQMASLSLFMQCCKESRGDEPEFAGWHQELREAAFEVHQAIEKLAEVARRYE